MSRRWLTCGSVLVLMISAGPGFPIRARTQAQPVPPTVAEGYPLLSDAAFSRIFDQISNWGRWGKDDIRSTYNLLTPEKRKQAAALVQSGISVSLEHTLIETKGPDVTNPIQKLNRGNKLIWEFGPRWHVSQSYRRVVPLRLQGSPVQRVRAVRGRRRAGLLGDGYQPVQG